MTPTPRILTYTCPKCGAICSADEDHCHEYVCACGLGWDDSGEFLARKYAHAAALLRCEATGAAQMVDEDRERKALLDVYNIVIPRLTQLLKSACQRRSPTINELIAESGIVLDAAMRPEQCEAISKEELHAEVEAIAGEGS